MYCQFTHIRKINRITLHRDLIVGNYSSLLEPHEMPELRKKYSKFSIWCEYFDPETEENFGQFEPFMTKKIISNMECCNFYSNLEMFYAVSVRAYKGQKLPSEEEIAKDVLNIFRLYPLKNRKDNLKYMHLAKNFFKEIGIKL